MGKGEIYYMENINSIIIKGKQNSRINSIKHTYSNKITWEKAFEIIIENHLKSAKLLD
jgi:hypothetical protein